MRECILDGVGNWPSAGDQYEIPDREIVALINSDDVEDLESETIQQPQKIAHSEGVKTLEATIQYMEQQEEARLLTSGRCKDGGT